jgi:integrase
LADGLIDIREKKRDKTATGSTRHCVLSASLRKCLEADGLDREYLVVNADGKPMTADMLSDQFIQTLKDSKWAVLRGWHTLRHSFGSICLRKGIPIHVTARWMGHTTQEMIELYQKTYIQDEHDWAKRLD